MSNDRVLDLEEQLKSSEAYVQGTNLRLAELETVLGHPTRVEDMSLHAIEVMIDQVKALKIQAESAESKNAKLIAQIDSLQVEIESNSAEIDRLNEVNAIFPAPPSKFLIPADDRLVKGGEIWSRLRYAVYVSPSFAGEEGGRGC